MEQTTEQARRHRPAIRLGAFLLVAVLVAVALAVPTWCAASGMWW